MRTGELCTECRRQLDRSGFGAERVARLAETVRSMADSKKIASRPGVSY